MKTELEQEDIKAIAEAVLEMLKPIIDHNSKHEDDTIFDVKSLAGYLKVSPKWIHEKTYLKSIPFYKLSNKQL